MLPELTPRRLTADRIGTSHGACAALLTALVALLVPTAPARAGMNFNVTAPANGFVGTSGLIVDLKSNWAGGPGYAPVEVAVRCVPASPRQRTLRIGLTAYGWYGRRHDFTAWSEVLVPMGATIVTSKLSMPRLFSWQQIRLEVYENGRVLHDLQTAAGAAMWAGLNNMSEGPSILFIEDAPTDISTIIGLFPNSQAVQNAARVISSSTTALTPATHPLMHGLPAADAPSEWLNYTSLDAVCLSISQIKKMLSVNPAGWKAICDWLAAGGNLWVYGVDSEEEAFLEGALKIPKKTWKAPDPAFASLLDTPESDYQGNVVDANGNPVVRPRATPPSGPAPFSFCDVGLGRVIALKAANPFPGTTSDWTWVLNSTGRNRWSWSRRHGLQFDSGNADFWNFLVPGVGLPPIGGFRFLITAFVLLIGPVNYFVLRRWNRLYLLMFLVPAGAAVITAALLMYAMFADGFGTRLRARTFTDLDQRRGHAASWSRLSYYAGVSPSGGLAFQQDTAILPLNYEPETDYNAVSRSREYEWLADQRLTRGWLPSRTPTQLITLRSRASKAGLKIVESGKRIRVENQLGTRIRHLLVSGSNDSLFYTSQLDPAQAVRLEAIKGRQPTDYEPLVYQMSNAFRLNTPTPPPGVDLAQVQYGVIGSFRVANGAATQNTNRLEQEISDAKAAVASGELAPRTYIAVVDQSPEAASGLSGANEEACFHVVRGRW